MFPDNSLTFNTSVTSFQNVTATADSTTLVDVTGAGVTNAPSMINGFPATNTAIGVDYGVGDGMAIPYVVVLFPAVTTVTGTLSITLAAAPDNGSYSPGTYTNLFVSGPLTGSTQLYANSVLYFQVPPTLAAMGEALPRFYKLIYTVVSGSISLHANAFITLNPPSFAGVKAGLLGGQYSNNFLAV